MSPKPPKPVVKSILACRELFQDNHSGEFVLVGPLVNVTVLQFPSMLTLNLLAVLTSMHGRYAPLLQLRDVEDQVCWSEGWQVPLDYQDPLGTHVVSFRNLSTWVPRAGKYDLVLLLNDEEVARHPFAVNLPGPAAR